MADIFDYVTTTGTSMYLSNLSNSTTYYWRVKAGNSEGWSDWSSAWYFTTESSDIPPAPTLISPPNGSTVPHGDVTLTWQEVPGAYSYRYYWSTNGINFGSSNSFSTSTVQYNLPPSFTSYWKVQAVVAGVYGPTSDTWYFTTSP